MQAIVEVILELDKLKAVTRKNRPLGLTRPENSAEHSWQIALLAIALAPFAPAGLNMPRVVAMLLVHDVGEIDTGDTVVYAEGGWDERRAAELKAVHRIFGLLPATQASPFIALWQEFDAAATPESKFAHAVDRAMPALLNLANQGQSWRENGISHDRVIARIGPAIRDGCPALWDYLAAHLDQAQADGWFGAHQSDQSKPATIHSFASPPSLPVLDDIQGTRTRLRPIQADDLPALLHVNGDPQVTAFLPYATWTGQADARAWLARMHTLEAAGATRVWAITLADDVIGTAMLMRYDSGSRRAELGYVLGRDWWRQGLMHDALAALLAAAFGPLGLRRIEAEVDPINTASMTLLRRLGFSHEGRLRQRWTAKGRSYDTAVFGLLAADFAKPKS